MTKPKAINREKLVAFVLSIIAKGVDLMPNEKLEKLKHEQYVAERKLTAAKHKEKRLESEIKRLTRSERTHRLCTRAGMLETFLREPTVLTDDDVMELLTFIFHSEAVQKKLNNRMMNAIRSTIKSLRDWIADIVSATKETFAEMEAEKKNASPDLSTLLRDYMNLRKAERSDWSRYGQQKGTADDLKAVSKALIYLKEHELFTLEDLDTALQGVNQRAGAISKEMKTASDRMKDITAIQTAVADCQTHKAVHDKYIKIGWKTRQAAFAEKHKDELTSYNKAYRTLKKHGVDLNVNLDALQSEYDGLQATHAELAGQLATVKEELQPMKDIRYWVGKVLTPEQSEVEKKPEPKHSLKERLQYEQAESKKKQEQKTPQHKKQNMEL